MNDLGEYYRFVFVKDEAFHKAVIETGFLTKEAAEGKSYDEIIDAINPDADIAELFFNEKVARFVSFFNDIVKAQWIDEQIFELYMPVPFDELVMHEFFPNHYIEGKDIDVFIIIMEEIYAKVKSRYDTMDDSEEKEEIEVNFLKDCVSGIEEARNVVQDGFCDRIVVGWCEMIISHELKE